MDYQHNNVAWIKQEHKISQPATEHSAKHLSRQYGSHGMFDNNKIFCTFEIFL